MDSIFGQSTNRIGLLEVGGAYAAFRTLARFLLASRSKVDCNHEIVSKLARRK